MATFQIISGGIPVSAMYDVLDELYAPRRVSNKERKIATGKVNKKVKKTATK